MLRTAVHVGWMQIILWDGNRQETKPHKHMVATKANGTLVSTSRAGCSKGSTHRRSMEVLLIQVNYTAEPCTFQLELISSTSIMVCVAKYVL